ncbi:MAG: phosphoribosyl-ATP diphosphatase [Rhodospirillales bacterium]|nr:phosphoribosyl-ATP diphosphatase [Rhodospirillales bacterium]
MANGNGADARVLDKLFAVICSRRDADPMSSYTAKLFGRGKRKIARKVGEEAVEVVVAALAEPKDNVVAESVDLLYHLAVLWACLGIDPKDVWAEMARREGLSGIAEKAGRNKS